MELKKISYEQACENFKDRIENIPSEQDILPEFINENISDFIMAGKPQQEHTIAQRERDKKCASVLLGKAINNVQYVIQDHCNKLLVTFSDKKIILQII